MSKATVVLRLLLLTTALANSAAADVSFEQLQTLLRGHTIALRVPFKGSEIHFDLEGRPIPPYMRGTLGRDGFVTITDITRDDHNIILAGHRAALLSFAPGEPLQLVNAEEIVRIGFAVASQAPAEIGRRIARIIHSSRENSELIAAYNLVLDHDGKIGKRQVTTGCELRSIATPIAPTLVGRKIEANVIVNELGEPEAVAFRTDFKKLHEKTQAATSVWNWRFAPVRSNGKLVSCSHALTIDTAKLSPMLRRY